MVVPPNKDVPPEGLPNSDMVLVRMCLRKAEDCQVG